MADRGVSPPVLHGGSPAWSTRVYPASYKAPDGTEIKFDTEDVSREIALRRTPFQFPGVPGVYVQDNGRSETRYPLRCFFWGPTHDLEAQSLEAAILQTGPGTLEHPFYGTIRDVIATGSIRRRDDLKSAANQTIIELDFWKTLRAIYPASQLAAASEITAGIEGFNLAAAQAFEALADLDTVAKQAGLTDAIRSFLGEISQALGTLSNATAAVNREFRAIESTINYSLDVFVGQPLLLAQQLVDLTLAPSRAVAGIQSRLDGYAALADRIMESAAGSPVAALDPSTVLSERTSALTNAFHGADLVAAATVAGAVNSCVEHTFTLRPEALAAANTVLDLFDMVVEWRDLVFAAFQSNGLPLNQIDTGESYQQLLRCCSLIAGYLVQLSFTLLPERRIVLGRSRTVIDLAGELYGEVDERLDDLINNNNLVGSEILELPAGREIVYYEAA